jgi:hypothetical protein
MRIRIRQPNTRIHADPKDCLEGVEGVGEGILGEPVAPPGQHLLLLKAAVQDRQHDNRASYKWTDWSKRHILRLTVLK